MVHWDTTGKCMINAGHSKDRGRTHIVMQRLTDMRGTVPEVIRRDDPSSKLYFFCHGLDPLVIIQPPSAVLSNCRDNHSHKLKRG